MNKKTLGVIGGLGPIATAHFMELVIKMTDARTDQEHLDMIIYNSPSIPDRTSYILDNTKPNPLPQIIEIGKALSEQKSGFIAIPCITAHYFHDELQKEISAPIIHIVKETVKHLKENGVSKVGIMATDGTISAGLFQKELRDNGMEAIIPSPDRQKDVMSLIYDCVKADKPVDTEAFNRVKNELSEKGAETTILGCTELSLIKRDYEIGAGFIDAMEVLAQQAVLKCGAQIKDEYRNLITK
jgi:aspartate racemase